MPSITARDRNRSPFRASARVRRIATNRSPSDIAFHEVAMKNFVTNQLADPFKDFSKTSGTDLALIEPPYNPNALMRMPLENNTLLQCIDAMVINIEGFGHSLAYIGEAGKEDSDESNAERERLEGMLSQPNGDYTLITLRKRLRADLETLGYAYIEVCRDQLKHPNMFYHVPAHVMRVTAIVPEPVLVTMNISRGGKPQSIVVRKQFRRFVQISNTKKIWFKQFGDPRIVDVNTGKTSGELPVEQQANEIFMLSLYRPGQVYGLPRWINQLPSILGSREAELTNLDFFKNNAIPALAVLVSGGQLSDESFSAINAAFNMGTGRDMVNRAMVLEATGNDDTSTIDGQTPLPRLDIKPLGADRQSDSLFDKYDDKCHLNIRGSFRIPPLFVGRADDYTRATAQASLVVAESQVFGTERIAVDDVFNLHLLPMDGTQLQFWHLRGNAPKLVGASDVLEAATVLNELGALTPNIAIRLANELFGLDVPEITHDWGSFPFEIVRDLAVSGRLVGIEDIERANEAVQAIEGANTDGNASTTDKQNVATLPIKRQPRARRRVNV